MRSFAFIAAFGVALLSLSGAIAQVYPSRPITLVVPAPPGGPGDILGRIIIDPMRVSLGQSLVIENVAGAGGTLGVGRVVRAAPDGYTAILGQWNSNVAGGAVYALHYDLLKDLEPVALLTSAPLWIVARNGLPAKDLAELIAWLKANPDKASAAIVGAGTASHVGALHFQNKTATSFRFVPYRGGGPAYQDLIAGHIDIMFAEASATRAYVHGGSIRAYAVLARTRWRGAPDTPTTEELGVEGVHIAFWQGIWVPKGTPRGAIAALNQAVVSALADPAVSHRLVELGLEIPSREQQTPAALAAYQRSEIERWWPIIKAANIKAE